METKDRASRSIDGDQASSTSWNALFRDYAANVAMYPRVHTYFRESQVPLLAVWGAGDEIFGPAGATAFADDLRNAEIHLIPGGHFLLESALDDVAALASRFLAKNAG